MPKINSELDTWIIFVFIEIF